MAITVATKHHALLPQNSSQPMICDVGTEEHLVSRRTLSFISVRAAVPWLITAFSITSPTILMLPLLKGKRATWLNTYINSVKMGAIILKSQNLGGIFLKHILSRLWCDDAYLWDISVLEEWTGWLELGDCSEMNLFFCYWQLDGVFARSLGVPPRTNTNILSLCSQAKVFRLNAKQYNFKFNPLICGC